MRNERGDEPSPPETEQERLLRLVADAAPVLDSIPFSVLVTDAAGRIVSMNAAAERLLGYRSAELLGELARNESTPSWARPRPVTTGS